MSIEKRVNGVKPTIYIGKLPSQEADKPTSGQVRNTTMHTPAFLWKRKKGTVLFIILLKAFLSVIRKAQRAWRVDCSIIQMD